MAVLRIRTFAIAAAFFCLLQGRGDVVTDWNNQALSAIRNESIAPPQASRQLAILHIAIHDAVNSIAPTHAPYLINLPAAPNTSVQAAVAAAGHRTLTFLFPSQTAAFDAALADSLASVADMAARSNGVALGQAMADLVLNDRSSDGASTSVPYIPSTEPGEWRRTPPFFRPPESPHWAYVIPFAMTSGFQFRPAGPPLLSSAQYAADLNQVKLLGAANSPVRTAEQTLIARFWSDFSYTVTPPGHWNQIAQNVAAHVGFSVPQSARLFALLNVAMADAAIAVWDAKYLYNFWRPVTAIQQAESDGNPDTVGNPDWTPLLNTPPFPEYVSGHSAFSAAAATILARFVGTDHVPFTIGSDAVPGVTRSYSSFADAAHEIALSRIYGGIHFLSADLDGLSMGQAIGEHVDRYFFQPLSTPPTFERIAATNGNFQIRVNGTAGAPCVLLVSTNLADWAPVWTNTLPFEFQESITVGRRFFRAQAPR
jgi:membrane-associated phospholipid phosphatase